MAMKVKDGKDDLSDLTPTQQQSLKSWEATFAGGHAQVSFANEI
jgi:hypothetical protein